jgi:hypothetical protein
LARVGPAPLNAWRCAMGCSEVAARSHARRLEREGWLARFPMTRGEGSPAPTWWAHHCGCAWVAAWLMLRGHQFLGDHELLDDRGWSGEISWRDYKGVHVSRHRPDLIELLETIKSQTSEACERARADRGGAVTVDARETAVG